MKQHTIETMIFDDWFVMLFNMANSAYPIVVEAAYEWEQSYLKGYSPREALDEVVYGE